MDVRSVYSRAARGEVPPKISDSPVKVVSDLHSHCYTLHQFN